MVLGFLVFCVYEIAEYVKKHDTLYLEFREYGIGFFAGVYSFVYFCIQLLTRGLYTSVIL